MKDKETLLKKISISKTEGEWIVIEKRIKESGKANLNIFLRGEICKLKMRHDECPNCVTPADGKMIEKRPFISVKCYEDMKLIALRMRMPVASVIDELILNPLLKERI